MSNSPPKNPSKKSHPGLSNHRAKGHELLNPQQVEKAHKKLKDRQTMDDFKELQKPHYNVQNLTPADDETRANTPRGLELKRAGIGRSLNRYLHDHPEMVDKMIRKVVQAAMAGNMWALEFITNRCDGKVAEVHKIDMENQVTLVFTPAPTSGVSVIDVAPTSISIEGEKENALPHLLSESSSVSIDTELPAREYFLPGM